MLYFNIHKFYIIFYAKMIPCVAPLVVQRFHDLCCGLAINFIWRKLPCSESATEKTHCPIESKTGCCAGHAMCIVFQ